MSIKLTPRMCRAARALLGWQQKDLAKASGVPGSTLGAFETKDETCRVKMSNNRALIEAFERAGLEFLSPDLGGPGILFRDRGISTDPASIVSAS